MIFTNVGAELNEFEAPAWAEDTFDAQQTPSSPFSGMSLSSIKSAFGR